MTDEKKSDNAQFEHLETLLAQAGGQVSEPFREIVEPIHLSTTYLRDGDLSYPGGAGYTRDANPGYHQPQQLIRALEGGSDALIFSSGVAAASIVFQALRPGMRIVAPQMMYWSLRKWLLDFCDVWGLKLDLFAPADQSGADSCGTANLTELLSRPTDLLWLESPANPTWDVTDIRAASTLAKQAGAVVCVDSTVATPVFSRPLELGADMVMHSATKYLNGHSDVLAGALVTTEGNPLWERIQFLRAGAGAVVGPFEAWLLTRGMRTLFPRVRLAAENAIRIAQHFSDHPALSVVLYPGLPAHPGHEIAARQMDGGFGAMLSLRFRGGAQAAIRCAANVRTFKPATSLGSTESLIEHRASVEGDGTYCPDDLLRVSVGIEHADDLIADLEQAMRVSG